MGRQSNSIYSAAFMCPFCFFEFTKNKLDYFGYGSVKRCPNCSNGIYPDLLTDTKIIKIAVTGAESSGKTAFLAALLQTLIQKTSIEKNATFSPDSNVYFEFYRHSIKPLVYKHIFPKKTAVDKFIIPIPVTCRFFNKKNEEVSKCVLIFYDISGRGLTSIDYIKKYAWHLKYADAIMELVDGSEFYKNEKSFILNQCMSLYRDLILFKEIHSNNKNGKIKVPITIILSKSDLLHDKGVLSERLFYERLDSNYNAVHFLLNKYFMKPGYFTTSVNNTVDFPLDLPVLHLLDYFGVIPL